MLHLQRGFACHDLSSTIASTSQTPSMYNDSQESVQIMIARQRSEALYQAVADGDISLDAILSLDLDWQGIAVEQQWSKHREQDESAAYLPTTSPIASKSRRHTRRKAALPPPSSTLPLMEESAHPCLRRGGAESMLRLDLGSIEAFTCPDSSYAYSIEESLYSCPSTPELSEDRASSFSSASSSVETEPSSPAADYNPAATTLLSSLSNAAIGDALAYKSHLESSGEEGQEFVDWYGAADASVVISS
ncbi:hypothetical protein CBS101457_000793 [Exobasidium rhododendri]|nr:hypothetical protein CBS101457_000793 [Exobasidium rhododendri]